MHVQKFGVSLVQFIYFLISFLYSQWLHLFNKKVILWRFTIFIIIIIFFLHSKITVLC